MSEDNDYAEEFRVALWTIEQQEMNSEALEEIRKCGRLKEYLNLIQTVSGRGGQETEEEGEDA